MLVDQLVRSAAGVFELRDGKVAPKPGVTQPRDPCAECDPVAMQQSVEDGKPISVTVHPRTSRGLTAEQGEKRKAYRQRPEVRVRQREYRKQRAAKLKALLAQVKERNGSVLRHRRIVRKREFVRSARTLSFCVCECAQTLALGGSMDAKPRQFTFKVTVTVTDPDADARRIAEEIQSNLESVGAESVSVEIEEGGTLSERLDQ